MHRSVTLKAILWPLSGLYLHSRLHRIERVLSQFLHHEEVYPVWSPFVPTVIRFAMNQRHSIRVVTHVKGWWDSCLPIPERKSSGEIIFSSDYEKLGERFFHHEQEGQFYSESGFFHHEELFADLNTFYIIDDTSILETWSINQPNALSMPRHDGIHASQLPVRKSTTKLYPQVWLGEAWRVCTFVCWVHV